MAIAVGNSVVVMVANDEVFPATATDAYYPSRQITGVKVSNPAASKYYRLMIGDMVVYEVTTGTTAPTFTPVDPVNIITGGKQVKLATDDSGTAFKVFLYL